MHYVLLYFVSTAQQFTAEEAVRTYGGIHFRASININLSLIPSVEQIPSPISHSRNVVIKQPVGESFSIHDLLKSHPD